MRRGDWRSRCQPEGVSVVGFLRVVAVLCFLVVVLLQAGCQRSVEAVGESGDRVGIGSETSRFRELKHDFGVLDPLETVYHEFELKNTSEQTWTVKQVVTTCACAVGRPSSSKIEPGQSSKFKVEFQGPATSKKFSKSIFVEFEPSSVPKHVLTLTGEVREPMKVAPEKVFLKGVSRKSTQSGSVQVANYSEGKWKDLEVTSDSDLVSVKARKAGADESLPDALQGWLVDYQINAGKSQPGRHTADIHVVAVGEERFEKTIHLQFIVTAPIKTIPVELFLGQSVDEPVTKEVEFLFASGLECPTEIELDDRELDGSFNVSHKWEYKEKGRGVLTVQMDPIEGVKPGFYRKAISIEFDADGVKERFAVPCTFRVPE